MAESEVAVSNAIRFFEESLKRPAKPVPVVFSAKSNSTDISNDGLKFAEQLVTQIDQKYGTDTQTKTFNIDEFTKFVSGGKIRKFNEISDASKKEQVQATFDDITGGRKATATAGNFAEYLRIRDTKDGKTDGQTTVNFLI